MKRYIIVLALLLGGCVSLSPGQRDALRTAADTYKSVTKEMSKAQILATLGQAQRVEGGSLIWEVRVARGNFESLTVDFDAAEKVVKLARVSNRCTSGPYYEAERRYEYGN